MEESSKIWGPSTQGKNYILRLPLAAFFLLFMIIADFYNKYFHPGKIFTDSRKVTRNSVFIALRGDKFNGNDFAIEALQSGAVIAVVDDITKNSSFFAQLQR